jgi:hypothetical protein
MGAACQHCTDTLATDGSTRHAVGGIESKAWIRDMEAVVLVRRYVLNSLPWLGDLPVSTSDESSTGMLAYAALLRSLCPNDDTITKRIHASMLTHRRSSD